MKDWKGIWGKSTEVNSTRGHATHDKDFSMDVTLALI
jgi:hypothetical protein